MVDEPLDAHPEEPFVLHLVGPPPRVEEAHERLRETELPGADRAAMNVSVCSTAAPETYMVPPSQMNRVSTPVS